jgi:hypothetical protein
VEIRLTNNITYDPSTWKLKCNGKEVVHNPMYPYTKIYNENSAKELGVTYEEFLYAVENLFLLSLYFGESRPDVLKLEAEKCQTFYDWMTRKLKKLSLVRS